MSELALIPNDLPQSTSSMSTGDLAVWNERRRQAQSVRRHYEPTWHICQSFLAGRQWVQWAPGGSGQGRVIEEPNPNKRERHTVNVLTQYVQTVMGKLVVEDLRPDVVFRRPDIESETVALHTQAVAKYVWDTETDAERIVYDLCLRMATYGTSALRCYYDTTRGKPLLEAPQGPDGRPILDPAQAYEYVSQAQAQGQQVKFVTIKDGQIRWEALSPFSILTPPGVDDDRYFPWLLIERPMPIGWAKMRYPEVANRLKAQDLRASEMSGVRSEVIGDDSTRAMDSGKLREHVLVTTGYEMPTDRYPEGRVVEWVADDQLLLSVTERLPYMLKGQPHHGIVFFHYHKVPGRFWALGVVEPLCGPQRQKNRARSQMIEMKDRNLGRVYAHKGTITAANKPVGKIMELVEIPLHAEFPQETTGVPVGPWIENEARINDEDMDRAAGLREVSLGQAPTGVSAYSAMALLAEQDDRRLGTTLKTLRLGLGDALLLSLELAKRYWQQGKQFAIAGPDGVMELYNYSKEMFPEEFYISVSRTAPLPTSPAVESQKIFDLFNAATSAGQPLPVDWLKDSLDQGRALPIPKREGEVQRGKAEQENLMITQGAMIQPAYYDDDFLHIQIHRNLQIEAMSVPGNEQIGQMLEMHIQMHVQNAAMKKPTSQDAVPQQQGDHGVEAQNGMSANMQGAAQQPGIPQAGMFNRR